MIREIAKKYNVKLYEVEKGDKYCQANGEESYHNTSYSAGSIYCKCGAGGCENNAEIWLGFYDEDEYRLLSFFHELGRVTDDTNRDGIGTDYISEKAAWDNGYELASEYGIKFTRKAKGWATRQLNSYKD